MHDRYRDIIDDDSTDYTLILDCGCGCAVAEALTGLVDVDEEHAECGSACGE